MTPSLRHISIFLPASLLRLALGLACLQSLFAVPDVQADGNSPTRSDVPEVVPIPLDHYNTFVVIPPVKTSENAVGRVQDVMNRLLAFAPAHALVLTSLETRADLVEQLDPRTVNLRCLPRLPADGRLLESVSWSNGVLWLHIHTPENDAEGASDILSAAVVTRIEKAAPSQLFLVTREAFWSRSPGTDAWFNILEFIRENDIPTTVIVADSNRFSHWDRDGIDFFALAAIDNITSPATPEGVFDGVLWGRTTSRGQVDLRILPIHAVLTPQDVSVQSQRLVETLQSELSATPILDRNPVTTITFRNPLDFPIELKASWTVGQGRMQVDPKIVGFTLAPGQTFEQTFRLIPSAESAASLKFMEPEFRLECKVPGPGGIPRAIELKTKPWCSLSSTISSLEAAPVVDGNLNEWTLPSMVVSHPSQITRGKPFWTGPKDLSASVHFAWDDLALHVAVAVTDDDVSMPEPGVQIADQVCLVIARQRMPDAESTVPETSDILKVCVNAVGLLQITPSGDDFDVSDIRGAAMPTAKGYNVEITIPARHLKGTGFENGEILADVNLVDMDKNQEIATDMTLSGRGMMPELFARLSWDAEQNAEAPQENTD